MSAKDVASVVAMERKSSKYPWSKSNLSRSIESGDNCQIVCWHSKEVGYYILQHSVGVTEILNLVVFQDYQEMGVGKQLLALIFSDAVRNQSREVWLEVRQGNEIARKLYKSAGFYEQGVRKGYYLTDFERCPSAKEDAILMACSIK